MSGPLAEKPFQGQVVEFARIAAWLDYHTYDSRQSNPGFPDLVLVRERILYAELKTDVGKVRPEQKAWLDALAAAGAEVYLWRPADWDDVVAILGRDKVAAAVAQVGPTRWLP